MKQAVINPMKCKPESIIASNRIARFLAMSLGCPLIDSRESCTGTFDRLFIVNGPMLYCDFRGEMQQVVNNAKEIYWVENDYTIQAPGFIKSREPFILSACENYRHAPGYHYVNWNQLTFDPEMKPRNIDYVGLFYYGAFRKGREKYFRKYFEGEKPYAKFISSSRNGMKNFTAFAPDANYIGASPGVTANLGAFLALLYIEDEKSHKVFTSPANRFYEALSAHALQFFDESCIGTFDKAGIDIRPWVVDSPEKVATLMKNAGRLQKEQLAKLRGVDYLGQLRAQFKAALGQK